MDVTYCEYDEGTGHYGCPNFPCYMCEDLKNEIDELKKKGKWMEAMELI